MKRVLSLTAGKRHAAIVASCEAVERAAVRAGRRSGDLVHPLPYCPEVLRDGMAQYGLPPFPTEMNLPFCPEFYRSEFASKVADMKNSVKDRMNAQVCAAMERNGMEWNVA